MPQGLWTQTMLWWISCPAKTGLPRPAHDLEQAIAQQCRVLAEKNGLSLEQDIEWVGGTPGSVIPPRAMEFNANFSYHQWELKKDMETLLPCPVFVENDANAAAYGEYIAGGARGAKALWSSRWAQGSAAALSSTERFFRAIIMLVRSSAILSLVQGGRPCMCGRRGCRGKIRQRPRPQRRYPQNHGAK